MNEQDMFHRQEMTRRLVIYEVTRERLRQISGEGHLVEIDDEHTEGELALAAVAYILADPECWTFPLSEFKPRDMRWNLIRAAALLIAEIERLDREMSPAMCADIYHEAARAHAGRRQEAE